MTFEHSQEAICIEIIHATTREMQLQNNISQGSINENFQSCWRKKSRNKSLYLKHFTIN